MGLGKTFEFYSLFSLFLSLGSDSIEDRHEGYIAPELNLFQYYFFKFKLNLNLKKKIYVSESLDLFESKLTYFISQNYDFLIKYNKYGDFDERSSLNLGYYF
jgi:hypothetical protein